MTKKINRQLVTHTFHPSFYSLFLILLFFTSCNGQVLPPPSQNVAESTGSKTGHPKLLKTQGSTLADEVRCALQDRAGNLWFGTTGEGVYRYDGKSFTQYTVSEGLTSNRIWSMLEDKSGTIWFGTDKGLCRFTGKTITGVPLLLHGFNTAYTTNSTNSYGSNNKAVWSMLQARNGLLWVGTGEGVYCYDGKTFTRFLDNPVNNTDSLQLKMVDCMLEDKSGNLWFASGMPPGMEGLIRFDGKSLTRYQPFGEKWIRYLIEDKNGILWIGTRHKGVVNYDGSHFTKFTAGSTGLGDIAAYRDKEKRLWFSGGETDNGYGGQGGIWRYDGQELKNFTTGDGLGDFSVWCFLEDTAGNLWIGTRNTGLYRYDGKTFTNFTE